MNHPDQQVKSSLEMMEMVGGFECFEQHLTANAVIEFMWTDIM